MGGSPDNDSLQRALADALPEDASFTFYHLSTPPTKCAALFSAPPGAKAERTYCEAHFLNVSIKQRDSHNQEEVLIFAIEILIYTTKHLTTLFVSKADSTGYIGLLGLEKGQTSPLRSIPTTFVQYLVRHRQRPGMRLVVSLFARAQDQYLFPGSVENKSKHVSDDRQLVKWWCRVLDPVLSEYAAAGRNAEGNNNVQDEQTTAQGYLIVPGEEGITHFLPPMVRSDSTLRKRWRCGHPLREITTTPNAPPRCLVPRFPDDPKARFLDELDDEIPDVPRGQGTQSPSKRGTGQWRSVKTLEQFWDMMAFRQECSSGRLVGFMWIAFTPRTVKAVEEGGLTDSQTSVISMHLLDPGTPGSSSGSRASGRQKTKRLISSEDTREKKLTGPIIPRLPRIKSGSSNSPTLSQPEESEYYLWPRTSRGQLVVDEKNYKRANDLLLRLDFATQTLAASSTRRWIEQVAVLAGADEGWGVTVVGRNGPSGGTNGNANGTTVLPTKRKADTADTSVSTNGATGANTLSSGLVRKKPQSDDLQTLSASNGTPAGINMLDNGVVRKKAKGGPESSSLPETACAVNVLGAGTVRKKPKG